MDYETKERLLSDLEEAKGSFDILIEQMKRMGIKYPYEKTADYVNYTYEKGLMAVEDLDEKSSIYKSNKEGNKKYVRRAAILTSCYLIIAGIVNYLVFICGPESNINKHAIAAFYALFFGGSIGTYHYMYDKHVDPYYKKEEKRVDYSSLKSKRKELEKDIDWMYSVNNDLFNKLDHSRVMRRNA